MNTFKKKALFAAVAGLGVMGMIGSAQAVNVNPNGLGQVLIYPYYTVRDNANGEAYNSLISIVNSTNVGKAVKVRFVEGLASKEVLDFNLYMSRQDVWTGAVVPTANGGAALFTRDTSCTNPPIPTTGEPFRDYQYTHWEPDLADQSIDRVKEGYVEVIEMADFYRDPQNLTVMTSSELDATHRTDPVTGNWLPRNCATFREIGPAPAFLADLEAGKGGLFGSMTLINPNEAQGVSYEATALEGFFSMTDPTEPHLWNEAGSIYPNLNDVNPATSVVVNGLDVFITEIWDTNVNAVSAVLMGKSVLNEFMLDNDVAGKTDWVVTFPTKTYYYQWADAGTTATAGVVTALFQNNFTATGACDTVGISYYDREERRPTTTVGFSPPAPGGVNALCWETNVITFGPGALSLLNAKRPLNLPLAYESGWAQLTFSGGERTVGGSSYYYHRLVANDNAATGNVASNTRINLAGGAPTNPASVTYSGLPVLGFAVQQYSNGEVVNAGIPGGKIWANYATRTNHRFIRGIE